MRSADNFQPWAGARAKIERAKTHLAEFDAKVQNYVDSKPYEIDIISDIDGTRVVFKSFKSFPVEWSAIVGDIVHNCRSALDLMSTHSAFCETKNVDNFKFPIFANQQDFERKAFTGSPRTCRKTIRFIKRIKPYQRGLDPGHHSNTLVILNRLSNRDKHNLIIPIGAIAAHALVTPSPEFGDPFMLIPVAFSYVKGGETILVLSPEHPLFAGKKFETEITFKICLSGVQDLPTIGASAMLHHVVKIVDRIVTIAEQFLFSSIDISPSR